MIGPVFGQSNHYVGHVCEVTPLTVVTLVSYWPIVDGLAETLSNVLRFCVVIM